MTQYKAGFWPDRAPSSAAAVRGKNVVIEAQMAELDDILEDYIREAKKRGIDPKKKRASFFSWLQDQLSDG